jgi:hypothetical protein
LLFTNRKVGKWLPVKLTVAGFLQVLKSSEHERQTMKDALEMAVLNTVSHPNIIRVYACLTDMVEHGGKGWAGAGSKVYCMS